MKIKLIDKYIDLFFSTIGDRLHIAGVLMLAIILIFSNVSSGFSNFEYTANESNSNQNWVNHTWNFWDGSVDSFILNRTDSDYQNYIIGIEALCRNVYKNQAGWMNEAGNDSLENWRNFGIPNCTAATPVQMQSGFENSGTQNQNYNNTENNTNSNYDSSNTSNSNYNNLGNPGTGYEQNNYFPASIMDDNSNEYERRLNDFRHEMKDREKELKNMERELKRFKDVSELQALWSRFSSDVQNINSCLNGVISQETLNTCEEMRSQSIGNGFKEFWDTIQIYNFENQLKDINKNSRYMKGVVDVSDLENKINEYKNCIQDSNAGDLCEDISWSIQDSFSSYWEQAEEVRVKEETKDMDKQIKSMEKELKRVEKSGNKELHSVLKGLLDKIISASGDEDYEEMRDLMGDFWDKMNAMHEQRACEDVKRHLSDLEKILEFEINKIIEEAKKTNPEVSLQMKKLAEEIRSILKKSKDLEKEGKCEAVFSLLETVDLEIKPRFEGLMESMGMELGNFIDFEGDYNDIYDQVSDGDDDFSREELEENLKKYGVKDIQLIKKITGEVLKQYLKNNKNNSSDFLKYASDANINSTEVQQLIESKNQLLLEIEEMKKALEGLKIEAANIVAQIESYNFGVSTSLKAKEFLEKELSKLSEAEAIKRLEELKNEAREEKYESGVIPFIDTDDDQWFTTYAAKIKEQGWVQGTGVSGGKEMNPSGITNVAEAITMFARVFGLDQEAVPTSVVGQRLPDWAKAAAGTLEQRGVNLDQIFGNKKGADVLGRGEVAVLIQQAFNLTSDEDISGKFNDIYKASVGEKSAIAAVNEAGIMTGQGDTGAFDVDGAVNRAALMKILDKASDLIGY